MNVGDKVRVSAARREHTGKVGTVDSFFKEGGLCNSVDVRFSGNQRAWLDEGDSYTVPYAPNELALVVEEVSP